MAELKYDYLFDPEADNNTAASVSAFALSGGNDVLDLGSGPAWVSRYLVAEQGRSVTCIDNDTAALRSIDGTGLRIIEADLESDAWTAEIVGESFDVVIVADVLEHLREPGRLLTRLLDDDLLKPDGMLVISVPNASHISVVAELALGDFRYTETGILDRTHVRWFTLESLERLLQESGFVVDRTARTTRMLESTPTHERSLQVPDTLRRELKELNPDTETYQFVVRARPSNAASAAARQREQLEDERRTWFAQLQDLLRDNRRLTAESSRASALLREEQAAVAREMELGAKELGSRERKIKRLETRVAEQREVVAELRRQLRQEKRKAERRAAQATAGPLPAPRSRPVRLARGAARRVLRRAGVRR